VLAPTEYHLSCGTRVVCPHLRRHDTRRAADISAPPGVFAIDRAVVARFDLAKNDLDRPVDSCLDHKGLFGNRHPQTEILRRPHL